ncbi:hypothetical protein Q9233_004963 [Columba guinea]|nr:hypothetical protein Q9233_004963 [Columba guinea]
MPRKGEGNCVSTFPCDLKKKMIQREAQVKNKVTAVALTDSVHNVWHQEVGKTIQEWMRENCCNWVSSSEPLDTSVESMLPDCPRVSAVILAKESFIEELEVNQVGLQKFMKKTA